MYQVITDRVIALLQQGTVPWHKPWRAGDRLPQNLISRRPYRGVNVFLLHSMAYESPFWLTLKQAKEMGGNVRKGEHACPVVFWKWLDVDEAGEATGKRRVPTLKAVLATSPAGPFGGTFFFCLGFAPTCSLAACLAHALSRCDARIRPQLARGRVFRDESMGRGGRSQRQTTRGLGLVTL